MTLIKNTGIEDKGVKIMFDEEYYLSQIGRKINSLGGQNYYDHQKGCYDTKAIDKAIEKAKIEGILSYDEWDIKKVAQILAQN